MESPFDTRSMEGRLQKKIKGEVRFDAGACALYAMDGSNYRQASIGAPFGVVNVLTYDGARMTVGATTDEELREITSEGGPRGQIYAKLPVVLTESPAHLQRKHDERTGLALIEVD